MAVYSFIAEEQADPNSRWSVAEMCRTLGVSRSGFYDWQHRPPSDRELGDRQLAVEIEAIWECSDRTYGAPRTHRWLRKQGFRVGRKRVARVMAANGWEGESGRRRVRTTTVDRSATAAGDLVARDFNPPAPDILWCGDITYLRTDVVEERNRTATKVSVQVDGGQVYRPALSQYPGFGSLIGTPSVRTGLREDVYLTVVRLPEDGETQVTEIPCGYTSAASPWVNRSSAAFSAP